MMKKVYICSALTGDLKASLRRAKRYAEYALKCGTAPMVPHFYTQCLDAEKPENRELCLKAGQSLLWFCDEMWICGNEVTPQMRSQIQFCKHLNIRTRRIREDEILRILGGNANEKKACKNSAVRSAVGAFAQQPHGHSLRRR